jgi:hypothetical protein
MKNKIIFVVSALFLLSAFFQAVFAGFQASLSIGGGNGGAQVAVSGGNQDFYAGLGEYYNVPPARISVVTREGITDDELPVVYFLATKGGVPAEKIIAWRARRHMSWMAIASRLNLDASVFYVPVQTRITGGVYGRLYNIFDVPKRRWHRIRLHDADIVDFVNLRFMSEHYGYRPEEIIRMRESGRPFVAINDDIRVQRVKRYGHDFHKWRGHENDQPNGRDDHRDHKNWN